MITIETFNEEEQKDRFYSIMGPHFASLDHKEIMGGWQLYNKTGSIWFLLFEYNKLASFGALFNNKTHLCLDCFITLEPFRKKGYAKELLTEIIKLAENKREEIRLITNNDIMFNIVSKFGFSLKSRRGSYSVMKKEIKQK